MSEFKDHSAASSSSNWPAQNQRYLEQTEEVLQDALTNWLEEVDKAEFSEEALDDLLQQLDVAQPEEDWIDVEQQLADFHCRFGDLFEAAKSTRATVPPQQKTIWARQSSRKNFMACKRIAAVIVLLFALLFPSMLVAEAFGLDVFGAIGRWTDETFQFTTNEDDENAVLPPPPDVDPTKQYTSMDEALLASGLPENLAPTWSPEGYTAATIEIHKNEMSLLVIGYYENPNGSYYSLLIEQFNQTSDLGLHHFEKDERPVETYTSGKKTFYIMSNFEHRTATWAGDKNRMITISGKLETETLKQIIDSIEG